VVTITARLYDANGSDTTVDLTTKTVKGIAKTQLLWVDVGRDAQDLAVAGEAIGVGDALVALSASKRRPAIARGDATVRVRVIGIGGSKNTVKPVPIDVFARKGIVVTIHDAAVPGLDSPIRESEGETLLGDLDAGAFLGVLLDGMLGGYFEAVEAIEAEIDDLDEKALRFGDVDALLEDLVALRRRIAQLRRALAPQRNVFSALTRPDAELEADILGAAWPGLTERFQQALDAVENARDLLIGCFDIVSTRTGQRTNDVMRILTVVSAVLLPSVVIAGVMGMNFKPAFFDNEANFFVVVGAMATLAILILLLARWRRWI
jgi:magnesium transporter